MTLAEGLKRIKFLKKRISDNSDRIRDYSSQGSNEKPILDTPEKQKAEILSLEQSNLDLAKEYLKLNANITYTNLVTKVKFNLNLFGSQDTYSINDLLNLKRTICQLIMDTYRSMNDSSYNSKVRQYTAIDPKIYVVRFYDELVKQKKLATWDEFYNIISSRLETINATTEILELP